MFLPVAKTSLKAKTQSILEQAKTVKTSPMGGKCSEMTSLGTDSLALDDDSFSTTFLTASELFLVVFEDFPIVSTYLESLRMVPSFTKRGLFFSVNAVRKTSKAKDGIGLFLILIYREG